MNGSWSPWILDLGKVQGRERLSLGWMPWLAGGFPNGSYDFPTLVGSVLICTLPVVIERGAFGGELLVWVGVCLPPFHSIRKAWLLSSPGLIFRLISLHRYQDRVICCVLVDNRKTARLSIPSQVSTFAGRWRYVPFGLAALGPCDFLQQHMGHDAIPSVLPPIRNPVPHGMS